MNEELPLQTTKNCSVLIADDAPFMRNMLRSILEMGGYTVIAEAADGAEAVAKYRELRPALALLDIVMPGKNGIEAASEIVSHDEGAKVILCGLGQDTLPVVDRLTGPLNIIIKPYKAEEVLKVVQRVTGHG